ncbi:hypothetical protein TWF481_011721 [Arthrobotrys musiformis]|uniref:Cyanovirin-N domain-containing protein n=1 Tax=Arthrobotrys musiformis TaxID=47236 RepID=A0AAV9W131_9PEZI
MKVQAIVVSGLALFMNTVPVFALPAPEPTESDDLTIDRSLLNSDITGPMIWSGSIDGGPEFSLEGTLEEVLPQILELNPQWELPAEVASLGVVPPSPSEARAKRNLAPTRTVSQNPSLVERYFKNRPTCNPSTITGSLAHEWVLTAWSIPWLRSLGDKGVLCGAQAYLCVRCSCEFGTKVELCNNTVNKIDISCRRLGDAAQIILDDCGEYIDIIGEIVVKGEWWDTTGYSAVVRRVTNSYVC